MRRILQTLYGRYAATLFALTALMLAAAPAQAWTYKVIYDFCGVTNCTNGAYPAGLLMDAAGNLYGTTAQGGAYNRGAVFELTPNGGSWTEQVLYSFCRRSGCPDGGNPGVFFMDVAGNLYGSAYDAENRHGIAFELMPNSDRSKWKLNTLHTFCKNGDCSEGTGFSGFTFEGARTGALYDGASPLYGTTSEGGANGGGTAFRLAPVTGTTKWRLKTLYDFCAPNCSTDAWEPGGLLDVGGGKFYGVSVYGGSGLDWGSIFSFVPRHRKEAVLYNFCTGGCGNGANPSSLTIDSQGVLWGAAAGGGNSNPEGGSGGVLFKYVPGGRYKVIYKFCSELDCADGALPYGLFQDPSGNFYGETFWGGDLSNIEGGGGVIFALNPSFQIIYTFCSDSRCSDGVYPSGLMRDGSGNFFGTAQQGGAHNAGVVFELSP